VAQQCSLPVHPIKIFRGDTRQSFKGLNQACGVLTGYFYPASLDAWPNKWAVRIQVVALSYERRLFQRRAVS
jgi:hypothetical protein